MRISDWSSDVCSSDLAATASIYKTASARATKNKAALTALAAKAGGASGAADAYLAWGDYARAAELYRAALKQTPADPGPVNTRLDRKSVVSGKSVSVRVDLGGRRITKKTNLTAKYVQRTY